MKVVDNRGNIITLELEHKEFNVIRELISAVFVSCTKEETPTLTGWTQDELYDFSMLLKKVAEENNINL